MPESKKRKIPYTPPRRAERKAVRVGSPAWLPVAMVTLWVLGLLWVVAWYLVPLPFLQDLGAWNIVIGFGAIAAGFLLSTRWY